MKKKVLVFLFLSFMIFEIVKPQSSADYKEILSYTQNASFPKRLVYDAPQLPISFKEYMQLGFDYVSVYSLPNPKSIPNRFKYILWTGIASNDGNGKWASERSPFVNDTQQYPKRWNNRLNYYKERYYNYSDKNKFGMMVLDIEARKSSKELEKNPPYRRGQAQSKSEAIDDYKTAMERLYRAPLEFAKSNHAYYENWSSYDDIPIERTWWNIPNMTWKQWISNPSNLNYITNQTIRGKTYETDFAKNLDFYSIGIYYFYSSRYASSNIANQYLAYLLFHLEANQEWTNKPIYIYHYFKYQGEKDYGTLIDETMVRNSVIFAFMSGAEGMVLYDDSRKPTNDSRYHQLIKTYIKSVSSLDKYRSYFTGKNVVFFRPDNPRDLFVERKPVIRGIEKNGKLLLAATNPFAKEKEITNLSVTYKGKMIKLQLKGKETYLEEIIL